MDECAKVNCASALAHRKVVRHAEDSKAPLDSVEHTIAMLNANYVPVVESDEIAAVPVLVGGPMLWRNPEPDCEPQGHGAGHVRQQEHLAVVEHTVQVGGQDEQVRVVIHASVACALPDTPGSCWRKQRDHGKEGRLLRLGCSS